MLPISTARFLLPVSADLSKWSVIACDQHSANPEYWARVAQRVKNSPSTLNFIYPEAYLDESPSAKVTRIQKIHTQMQNFKDSGAYREVEGAIFIIRKTSTGRKRYSLLLKLDLESYSFTNYSGAQVRASEATVPERIPPRLQVKRGANFDLSHVQLLFDDPDNKIITLLQENLNSFTPLYDFDLMLGGGHLQGHLVHSQHPLLNTVMGKLEQLRQLHGTDFDFLVGDGNHSLACAKVYWEELKAAGAAADHPARYMAVELINIHDEGLEFEPIHRLLAHTDLSLFADYVSRYQNENPVSGTTTTMMATNGNTQRTLHIQHGNNLAVNRLQEILDAYIQEYHPEHPEYLEYIHDESELFRMAKDNTIGIIVTGLKRAELFPYVYKNGPTARKTFSLGHAADKRYYVELRDISH